MEEALSKRERRRALNMIWNAAGDYSIEPALRVYDGEGRACLYWNSVVGAVHRHYDFAPFQKLFTDFAGHPAEIQLKNLLWLGLESAAYKREFISRPALASLRLARAQKLLAQPQKKDPTLYERLEICRASALLGRESPLYTPQMEKLLHLLDFGADMDEAAICARALDIFAQYLHYMAQDEAERKERAARDTAALRRRTLRLPDFLRKKKPNKDDASIAAVPGLGGGRAEHQGSTAGDADMYMDYHLSAFNVRSVEELRRFMENFFGDSLYTDAQMGQMERSLCSGNHSECHLHFTRGAFSEKEGFKSKDDYLRMTALRQLKKNRAYYEENAALARRSIALLSARIRSSMLTYLQNHSVKSRAGRFAAGRAWRYAVLGDERVFDRDERAISGDVTVDIVLDGSSSQARRQEILSTQAYIIAESLSRCNIPVRISSFCSLRGFTVFRIFREYTEQDRNQNVFCYFTAGCNRDGLAIRAARRLMETNPASHRLLILLSDARPNALQRVRLPQGGYANYSDEIAVNDSAAEVRAARHEGVRVLCVFTGEDDALPAAKRIYGTGFTRIPSLEHFAEAVGKLIQEEIRNF